MTVSYRHSANVKVSSTKDKETRCFPKPDLKPDLKKPRMTRSSTTEEARAEGEAVEEI